MDHKIPMHNSGEYCYHNEKLNWTEVEIPLTIWNFDGQHFLEQIFVDQEDVIHILILFFGEKEIANNYDIEIQLLREGVLCAPLVRQ